MLRCALWNKRGCGVIWGVTLLWSDEVKPAVWFKCVWTELRVWFLHPVNCSKNRAHTCSVCRVRMIAYSCCLTDINKELRATRCKLCLVEEHCFGWASAQIVCTDECRLKHRCTPYITEDTCSCVKHKLSYVQFLRKQDFMPSFCISSKMCLLANKSIKLRRIF